MVLPSTGVLSFSAMQTEFGGTNPISMSEYYTNASGGYTTGVTGVPSIGAIISAAVFRGKSKSTGNGLYNFSSFTFTNAGATGRNGPTLSQCRSAYLSTAWAQDTTNNYLNMTTQGIQEWKVPATGSYTISIAGARGGSGYTKGIGSHNNYGNGIVLNTTVNLTQGDVYKISVGQVGDNALLTSWADGYGTSGGGGGASCIAKNGSSTPLIIAGGGGGGSGKWIGWTFGPYSGTNALSGTTPNSSTGYSSQTLASGGNGGSGNAWLSGTLTSNHGAGGGGGWYSSGGNGQNSSTGGAALNSTSIGGISEGTVASGYYAGEGGFGGGGGGRNVAAAGGGGYNGGSCGGTDTGAGYPGGGAGGSSYLDPSVVLSSSSTNSGNGYVTITPNFSISVSSASWVILMHSNATKGSTSHVGSETQWGSTGSATWKSITSSSTGASSRTAFGHGVGLYNGFFTAKNITKIALVDGTGTLSNPTSHTNYLIYDLVGSTGTESIYEILKRLDNYNTSNGNWAGNDGMFLGSNVTNFTAGVNGYSGTLSQWQGSMRTNSGGVPSKFCIWGINVDSDNDTQVLCTYEGDLASGKGDSWRSDNPSQTHWSYWGNDWHSNTVTQTISSQSQTNPGIGTSATGPSTIYVIAYAS